MPQVCCIDVGCRENQYDNKLIRKYFQLNGWSVIDDMEKADLIILNSCGYSENTEAFSLKTYNQLNVAKKPGARLVWAGCLPAINPDVIHSLGYHDIYITPRTLNRLDNLINAKVSIKDVTIDSTHLASVAGGLSNTALNVIRRIVPVLRTIPFFPVPRFLWQFKYFPGIDAEYVRVSVGCMGNCSYCAIRQAKGSTKSVELSVIARNILNVLDKGAKTVTLVGDELGSYGQDINLDIGDLLNKLTSIRGGFKLIIRNIEPEWLIQYWDKLKPSFSTGKIAYIITPLQSGSEKVLKMMNRKYTAREYKWIVEQIREIAPETIIRSHIIVGFPGETEADFRESYNFVNNLKLDHFRVFRYTDRPSTPASKLLNKVPENIIERRWKAMTFLNIILFFNRSRWFPLKIRKIRL